MPTRERVAAFVSLVEQGEFVEAIEQFYTENASMQENNEPPRVGRAKLVENERSVMERFKNARARKVGPALIDGDHVIINWIFEFPLPDGRVVRLDEIARQRWSDDRIAEERFYYDPKQMRP